MLFERYYSLKFRGGKEFLCLYIYASSRMKTFTAHSSVVPALLILRANAAITSRVLARVRRQREGTRLFPFGQTFVSWYLVIGDNVPVR